MIWAMFLFEILLLKMVVTVNSMPLMSNKDKIIVALSERKPFVILNSKKEPRGLDVIMIQNFAEKFSFDVKYVVVNESLNYVFSDEHFFDSPSFKEIISR